MSCAATALLLVFWISLDSAQGASATWNGNQNNNWIPSQTGPNSNWSTGNHTFPGAVNTTTNTDTATFNISGGNPTITLNPSLITGGTTLNLQSMTFDTASVGAFTIGTTGGPTLVLTNGGTIQMTSAVANNETINAPISLAPASSVTSGSYSFTNNASSSTRVLTFGGGITGGTTTSSITLTLSGSNTGNNTISGIIGNGTTAGGVAVTKSGPGTWVLTGTNTFTGTTNISGGTLSVGAGGLGNGASTGTTQVNVNNGGTLLLSGSGSDHIRNSAGVALSGGGIINTGGLSEGTRPTNSGSNDGAAGVGALTLQSTSSGSHAIIDFTNANGSTLAASSLIGGSGAFLDIKNWTHSTLTTDDSSTTNDRLLFANNPGLSASDLANVQFFNDSGILVSNGGQIITYGNMFELVAIPEPSAWFAAALALGAIVFTQRKRVRVHASSTVKSILNF